MGTVDDPDGLLDHGLHPARYFERSAQIRPVLEPSGRGWNALGMHQIDAGQADGSWVGGRVDGFGDWRFAWRH
jgi:hypothetical protein